MKLKIIATAVVLTTAVALAAPVEGVRGDNPISDSTYLNITFLTSDDTQLARTSE